MKVTRASLGTNMPEYLDKLKDKRARQKTEQDLSDSLNATKRISDEIVRQNSKNRSSVQPVEVKNPVSMQGVIDSLNNLNLTTWVSSNNKYGELVEKMCDLCDELEKVSDLVVKSGMGVDKTLESAIKHVTKMSDMIKSTDISSNKEINTEIKKLAEAINNLDLSPHITVSAPDVTVRAPQAPDVTVDTKPISEILDKQLARINTAQPLLLDNFKALNIDDDAGGMQYVSFMNPDGCWYIIENDIDGGSLRYKFGKKNYKSAWRSHVNLDYKLLNEAVDEVRS